MEQCPHNLGIYRCYRDDTIAIAKTTTIEDQELATEWLNQNVYQGKIKCKMEAKQDEIK